MLPIKDSIKVSIRSPYSAHHIQAAALFARLSCRIELEHKNEKEIAENIRVEHRAYVTGAILTSVACLEATINEVFADTVDNVSRFEDRLEQETLRLMASLWSVGEFKRYTRILDKCQIALKLAGRPLFEKGIPPYQDVPLLVKLRNALVHYEPEWIAIRSDDPADIQPYPFEKMLKGKFPLNALIHGNCAFYPHRCLSHGCAKWAVDTSLKFVEEFCTRMNIRPSFAHIRSSLQTEQV